MTIDVHLINLAVHVSRLRIDKRRYFHGAVGIRSDGVIVCSANGNPPEPDPLHHAETRLLRKLGSCGTIVVVRTSNNGDMQLSKPCNRCMTYMRNKSVQMVYWSVNNHEFDRAVP